MKDLDLIAQFQAKMLARTIKVLGLDQQPVIISSGLCPIRAREAMIAALLQSLTKPATAPESEAPVEPDEEPESEDH